MTDATTCEGRVGAPRRLRHRTSGLGEAAEETQCSLYSTQGVIPDDTKTRAQIGRGGLVLRRVKRDARMLKGNGAL
jgi:hypothetical protein